MHLMLRGFGLDRALRAPEDDEGFEIDDADDGDAGDEGEDDEDLGGEDLDDDLDDQGDDEGGDDQGDEPPPRQSRGEGRQARLAREAKDLREENERLRREASARAAAPAPVQPQETQEQFNTRVAAMGEVERVAYLTDLGLRNNAAEIASMKFMLADQGDKLTFDSFCTTNTQAKKLAGEVDKRLQDYRKGGVNIPRMDVLKRILGERALDNLGRSRTRAERQADARREQQRGRPTAGRGDVTREGRDTGGSKAARDKRVENMKI